jgi:hypothetical protein
VIKEEGNIEICGDWLNHPAFNIVKPWSGLFVFQFLFLQIFAVVALAVDAQFTDGELRLTKSPFRGF